MRTLPLLLVFGFGTLQAAPVVWVVSSMERVGRSGPAGAGAEVRLYAARGETESFQVVVRAPQGGLRNGNVQVSALEGTGTIPAKNVSLYREHYVRAEPSSPNWHGK